MYQPFHYFANQKILPGTSLPLFIINSITTIYQADLNHYMYIALIKVRYISHILYSSIANEDMLK